VKAGGEEADNEQNGEDDHPISDNELVLGMTKADDDVI
jgi:hypothetical protein